MASCCLFTNHALVLFALHRNADARQRDIAKQIGITQGAVQRLLHDLTDSGHVVKAKTGRRNHYEINPAARLRHPLTEAALLRPLLETFATPTDQEVAA